MGVFTRGNKLWISYKALDGSWKNASTGHRVGGGSSPRRPILSRVIGSYLCGLLITAQAIEEAGLERATSSRRANAPRQSLSCTCKCLATPEMVRFVQRGRSDGA